MKNRRANHYRNGWLDVPEKYAYLKNNANMRDPTASRTKKALSSAAAKQTMKDSQGSGVQKGKGKAVRMVVQKDDDEDGNEEEYSDEEDQDEQGEGSD